MLKYTPHRFSFQRRKTISVPIGKHWIGSDHPILIQSMTNTNTRDIKKTVQQSIELAKAGCELIRITAPTVKDAQCLQEIVKQCRLAGIEAPFCADIHFQPKAAFESLKWVEKVRINPGNFVDTKTGQDDYSDADFARGQQKVYDSFLPFIKEAKKRQVTIRIGTNHGSLSDRMMARYGDTVEGMVESALEFLKICEIENYTQVVFSMKSSNSKVVIQAYRLLAARLQESHQAYPFHLGVTEAGDGQDGRLKSAAGIGALLLDGIGDTIRVSLTENPVEEIPVAQKLVLGCQPTPQKTKTLEGQDDIDYYNYHRRPSVATSLNNFVIGNNQPIAVGGKNLKTLSKKTSYGHFEWDIAKTSQITSAQILQNGFPAFKDPFILSVQTVDELPKLKEQHHQNILDAQIIWTIPQTAQLNLLFQYRFLTAWLTKNNYPHPLLLSMQLDTSKDEDSQILLTTSLLSNLLNDGYGDALFLKDQKATLTYDILQASSIRHSKAEFISCPSCGRTLFDLETTTQKIKSLTGHLSEISIAIMGCIVNGPGEMADADFGYVGGAPGKVNLYVKQDCVQKGIDEAQAPDALVKLIKAHGQWLNPKPII